MGIYTQAAQQATNRPSFQTLLQAQEEFNARKLQREQEIAQKQQSMDLQKQQIEEAFARKKALSGVAQQIQSGQMSAEDMQKAIAGATGDPTAYVDYQTQLDIARQKQAMELEAIKQRGANGQAPSSVKEWMYYNSLSADDKERYLQMKRADQILNLGGQMAVRSPTGGIQEAYDVIPKETETPEYIAAQKLAETTGKATGESAAKLTSMRAQRPRLEQVVNELSSLGQKATYTHAGQLSDAAMRQLGLPVGEGAIARAEYIAKIDNEVLPLLRQTFGAQFTEREGQSLKNTLGDPNKSPQEKDAVLRAFIEQKVAEIESLERATGYMPQQQTGRSISLEEFLNE